MTSTRPLLVSVSGLIGVGKSTLTTALAKELGWDELQEPVEANEFLDSFYANPKQYATIMQVHLLNQRYAAHRKAVGPTTTAPGVVVDRSVFEDSIFAKMLHESGDMDDREFRTYTSLVHNMSPELCYPDVIVYLETEPEKALERVKLRGRDCEKGLPLEYLRKLKAGYDAWIEEQEKKGIPVLRLDWSEFQAPSEVATQVRGALATLVQPVEEDPLLESYLDAVAVAFRAKHAATPLDWSTLEIQCGRVGAQWTYLVTMFDNTEGRRFATTLVADTPQNIDQIRTELLARLKA